MALPRPRMPPYEVRAWQRRPFGERLRMVCECWALHGYGTPWPVYGFYVLKVGLYVGGWLLSCSAGAALGGPRDIAAWWLRPEALARGVIFSLLFEGLGLGCASGPLTGRYWPPVAALLHFARPGTTRLALFPSLPGLRGDRRTGLDAALYLLHVGLLLRALASPVITPALLLPTAILLPLLGLRDKTIFLASRAEHYYTVLVCLLFPSVWVAGAKWVWVAIWWWAATSKLNHHFAPVVAVMQSNSPLTAFEPLRKLLFRRFPDDLRPSTLVHVMAHAGTAVEYLFPVLLLGGAGGPLTQAGLVTMVLFHAFITSSVPMGVPIEWNVIMVYGGFVLFSAGGAAAVSPLSLSSPPLAIFLIVSLLVVPLLGNLLPARFSFLSSMRYYAGNWAYSVWLFRGDCSRRLERLVKAAPHVRDQLLRFYDDEVATVALSKVMAFRAMHLSGRALARLLPRVVDDLEAYEYLDGELVAGLCLGWNFGEGHLHDHRLLAAVQRQCGFAPGELRCLFVESQPLLRPWLAFRIADAHDGLLEEGRVPIDDLRRLQPFPPPAEAPGRYPSEDELSSSPR